MDVEDLPEAGQLWWTFALATALAELREDKCWSWDHTFGLLRYDGPDGVHLRMQRLHHGRCVLWGSWPGADPNPYWSGLPGWASSDAVHHWLEREGVSFVAWERHGEWDTATPEVDLRIPLRPLLRADVPADLVAAARGSRLDADSFTAAIGARDHDRDLTAALAVLAAARDEAPPLQGAVGRMLATEIRMQMLGTMDRERVLPQRPAQLVHWARVATPPRGFNHAVHQQRGELVPALGNPPLAEQHRVTLTNVLDGLHHQETSPEGGSWLFARVGFDGVSVHLDRAFDSRPRWYEDDGPSLDTLAAEMARRDPRWRPAWARLLPDNNR